jgi:hypothetical protein
MEQNKILEKVRALVANAEHPSTDPVEAKIFRAKADELMAKHLIEEWELASAGGRLAGGIKPTKIVIDIGDGRSEFLAQISQLAGIVADFCRCRCIWNKGSGWVIGTQEHCTIYGFESDLRYFELLFTVLHLHMVGAIFPSPDSAKSLEDNCWNMHEAGFNWLEIAEMYGWRKSAPQPDDTQKVMYWNVDTLERISNWKCGGIFKYAYQRACKARHVAPKKIPAGGSKGFRYNAAYGYLTRIQQRLEEQRSRRTASTELVLSSRGGIDEMIAADYSKLLKREDKEVRYNHAAYISGVRHANTADLQPSASNPSRGELA